MMLIYVDGPKVIRVLRPTESTDGPKRIMLGTITKDKYEFRGQAVVTDDEKREMEMIIDSYKAAESAKLRAQALSFPQIARQVASYYAAQANDVERRLISVAILEMSRAIRKVDKPQTAATAKPA